MSLHNRKMSLFQVEYTNGANDKNNGLTRGSEFSAGYDIRSNEPFILGPGEHHAFDTGIILHMHSDYFARISPRSGLAYRNMIDVMAGIIDPDYKGVVKVILINHSKDQTFHVKKGDRIAQLIFHRRESPDLDHTVNNVNRGTNGFGSTGMQ